MRPTHLLCRSAAAMVVVLATALGLLVSASPALSDPPASESSIPDPLVLSADSQLSPIGRPIELQVSGRVPASLQGAELVVVVLGPVDPDQVGKVGLEFIEAAQVVYTLGKSPSPPPGDDTAGAAGVTGGTGTAAPSLPAAELGPDSDLAAGVLDAGLAIPAGTPSSPGAYLIELRVKVDGEVLSKGTLWLGKAVDRDTPLDVAFVLPLSLGIHRDASGAFFDRALEQAVATGGSDPYGLPGLLGVFERFPQWDFTLAPEPYLLTQLRDMSDGYRGVDESGEPVEVSGDDPPAIAARAALADLTELCGEMRVEVTAGPYSGADLDLIASQGWRDGLEQIQMGKQELQQTLRLDGPVIGAYPPDLGLTSEALTYYAQASVDHVVVTEALRDDLAEDVGAAVAARVRDVGNDRVTLVFASDTMMAAMSAPWDGSLFGAALAAELAARPTDAIVITPGTAFSLPPATYVGSVGEVLNGAEWIRTQTLTALIRAHSPGTRPVLLQTGPRTAQGYIEESLLAALVAAHTAVTDLASAADSTRTPLDSAYRLLAVAESGWWSRPGVSPAQASIGLDYAAQAEALARAEVNKVRFTGAGSTFITGGDGSIELTVENGAVYPMTVDLRLEGRGVEFPGGGSREIELAPGITDLRLEVAHTGGGDSGMVAILATGTTVLDELSLSLRFMRLSTLLPWLIAAVVVIAVAVYLVIRRVTGGRGADGD